MEDLYKHYIRVDENDYVIGTFSDAFEQPQEGDIYIEDGERHYNLNLWIDRIYPKYKYVDDEIIECTQEQLDAYLSDEEKLNIIRIERNRLLAECDYVVIRHRDQVAALNSTTITLQKYQDWLDYRQALRDMPEDLDLDLDNPIYPTKP